MGPSLSPLKRGEGKGASLTRCVHIIAAFAGMTIRGRLAAPYLRFFSRHRQMVEADQVLTSLARPHPQMGRVNQAYLPLFSEIIWARGYRIRVVANSA